VELDEIWVSSKDEIRLICKASRSSAVLRLTPASGFRSPFVFLPKNETFHCAVRMDLFAVEEWGKSSLEFILGADKGRSRAAFENERIQSTG
jgi:hypothetical protein